MNTLKLGMTIENPEVKNEELIDELLEVIEGELVSARSVNGNLHITYPELEIKDIVELALLSEDPPIAYIEDGRRVKLVEGKKYIDYILNGISPKLRTQLMFAKDIIIDGDSNHSQYKVTIDKLRRRIMFTKII